MEKDKEIVDLMKTVESLKLHLAAIPSLEKGLEDVKAEHRLEEESVYQGKPMRKNVQPN